MSNSEEMWKFVWSLLKESVRALQSQESRQEKKFAGIVMKLKSVMDEKKSSSGNAKATLGREDFGIACLLGMLDDEGKTPLSYANPRMKSIIKTEGIWVGVGSASVNGSVANGPLLSAFECSPDWVLLILLLSLIASHPK